MAGSAVIEAVYTWPGVGNLMIEAINRRDTTLACGCVIMTAILYVVMLLIVDIIYAFIDPRIKAMYSAGRKKKRGAEA
ncbi:MAG: ABC transporter permease subunit, partial [Clostridiales bacterium]|nr:ABC transporter permease subunit [Clostridiales bacterium]